MSFEYLFIEDEGLGRVTDPKIASGITELLRQLRGREEPSNQQDFTVAAEQSFLLLAIDGVDSVVGMATLVPHYRPSGSVGSIEELVVHKDFRRRGIGTQILVQMRRKARVECHRVVELLAPAGDDVAREFCSKAGFELSGDSSFYSASPEF